MQGGFVPIVTPPCRICGKAENVYQFPGDHSQTICVDCCGKDAEHSDGETGHVFQYERFEGHICKYCGVNRDSTDWKPDCG